LQHGDIIAQITMSAEPSRLFRFWRSTLRDAQPESAAVTIRKRNKSRFDCSPDFHLTSVTRSERKLADMSLSAMSLKLEAGEIEHAVRLHDILWDWLSYRRKDPVLDDAMPFIDVGVTMSGPAETVISQLETMHDLTPLFSVQFQVAFLQGRPTTVQARTPKSMETSADLATMLQDIETYRQRMAEGQAATLKALGQRLAAGPSRASRVRLSANVPTSGSRRRNIPNRRLSRMLNAHTHSTGTWSGWSVISALRSLNVNTLGEPGRSNSRRQTYR
jgi:hypothetical protein